MVIVLVHQRGRSSLFLRTARVEITLEHDLGGQLVAHGFAFLSREASVDQASLGFDVV